jgi:uncharacterized protein with PQ loop repeat
MSTELPIIAGMISTALFVSSQLPMLVKAIRTKDLRSYSLGHLLLCNAGNALHSVYVLHLPMGPVWLLHGFHLVATALMLTWYLRYSGARRGRPHTTPAPVTSRIGPAATATGVLDRVEARLPA